MLRGVAYVVSVGLSFLILLLAAGLFTPADFQGRVSGQIDAPAEKIWLVLHDLESIRSRFPEVKRIEPLDSGSKTGPGLRTWKTVTDSGSVAVYEAQDHSNRRMTIRMIESSSGFTGSWEYEISGNEMTLLTITERSHTTSLYLRALSFFTGRDARLKREFRSLQYAM
ncbi:MAG: SRPBCC family protein [Leptospirales bacterium]|nr:SRPBCC family protein [Leptospirales bacterium]